MYTKIFLTLVVLATAQSIPISPLLWGGQGLGLDDDIVTRGWTGRDMLFGGLGFGSGILNRGWTGRDTLYGRLGIGGDLFNRGSIGRSMPFEGTGFGGDLLNRGSTKKDILFDGVETFDLINNPLTGGILDIDRKILINLIKLDIVNRPLVKRLLTLDVVDRKIVGDLARGINNIIIKKGQMYPLTLWDRVLKIKGDDTPFLNRGIVNNWVETEIEDKEILKDLIKVDTVDRRLVTSLLWTNIIERKIVADLAYAINMVTLKRGPTYPLVLLDKVSKINGGFDDFTTTRGFGLTGPTRTFGVTNMVF